VKHIEAKQKNKNAYNSFPDGGHFKNTKLDNNLKFINLPEKACSE
jgi:hypothetical protein